MTTSSVAQFEINGVIDTAQNVFENMTTLANASGCFVTWDPDKGYWAFVINTTGSSVKSFNDTNIIGAINVQGSGIDELYNSVSISFPNLDLNDTRDVIEFKIPPEDRYPQELDNRLEISLDVINNPVQAQLIAARELKQSRVDKIITFKSNYTANGLKAGQLISVTASMYGYTNKVFRVIQINEEDDDEGNIIYSITGLEYDPNVYTTTGLIREERNKKTGIVPKDSNEAISLSEDQDVGTQVGRLLGANALVGLINSFFATDPQTGEIANAGKFSDPVKQELMQTLICPDSNATISKSSVCDDGIDFAEVQLTYECESCFFDTNAIKYSYTISGVTANQITIPLTGFCVPVGTVDNFTVANIVNEQGQVISPFIIKGNNALTQDAQITITISNENLARDFVLNTTLLNIPERYVYSVSASQPLEKGDTATVTVVTRGFTNGQTVAWELTGDTGIIPGPKTGNLSINGNTGTLSIPSSDNLECGDASVTVTFTQPEATPPPCAGANNVDTIIFDESAATPKLVSVSPQFTSVVEGQTLNINITSQNVANGTTVNYTISGSGTTKISTPLTGTVTLNNNAATLSLVTTNDNIYTGVNLFASITFSSLGTNCSDLLSSITILDATPKPVDKTCSYVSLPVVWCGTYDATTGFLKSITVKRSAFFHTAPEGQGVEIPTGVSVTNPNTANAQVTITSTTRVMTGGSGAKIDVITAFDPPPSGGGTMLTGTTVTLNGYF